VLIILIPLTWLAVTTIVLAACQAGAAADRPAEADALRSHLRRPVDWPARPSARQDQILGHVREVVGATE